MSVRVTRDYSIQEKNVKIAMHKSLLKEFYKGTERVVYLEDGDEFQIQIFNGEDTEVGAKIYVNGEAIGNSFLVIKPGERVWLDRWISTPKKLLFSTYEVNGNNEQVKKAIAENGVVKVELFRKKKSTFTNDWNWNWNQPIITTYPQPYEPKVWYANEPYSTCTTSVSAVPSTNTINYFCQADSDLSLGSASACTATFASATTTAASKYVNVDAHANEFKPISKKLETGRVAEGNHSDQEFNYVNMSFECWPFDTETIHILPKSTKPTYAEDLQKVYCPNCGRKLKAKFNFCPFCGEEL